MITMLNLHYLNKKIQNKKIHWLRYFLLIIFFIGLIVGSMSIKSNNLIIKYITDFYEHILNNKNEFTYISILLNVMLISIIPLILSFFIGVSATGVPISVAIEFFLGILLGIISGYTYEVYLLKGLLFCAVNLFPAAIILVVTSIYAIEESMNMSIYMLSLCTGLRTTKLPNIKRYCLKFLLYLSAAVVASTLTVISVYLFEGLFIFN